MSGTNSLVPSSKSSPTAQPLFAPTTATPYKFAFPGLGEGSFLHVVPFQCSVKGLAGPVLNDFPTTQTSVELRAATSNSSLLFDNPGSVTWVYAVPSHCSTRG